MFTMSLFQLVSQNLTGMSSVLSHVISSTFQGKNDTTNSCMHNKVLFLSSGKTIIIQITKLVLLIVFSSIAIGQNLGCYGP